MSSIPISVYLNYLSVCKAAIKTLISSILKQHNSINLLYVPIISKRRTEREQTKAQN